MLLARIRTGYWGFAEIANASNPPVFYPLRMTTYEHELDGGSGYCANGAAEFSREGPLNQGETISMELIRDGSCGQCGALKLFEIERTREELRDGEFVTLKELDESIQAFPPQDDPGAPTHRILRWGRDIFRPSTQRPSGRPDWFRPRGLHNPNTGPADPWVATKDQSDDTKTTAIREDVWTRENTRVCGAIVATTPDPAGTIVSTENKAAVTVNREDGTSMRRVRPGFGVPGLSQDCIDYGSRYGAVAVAGSVADAQARYSLVAEGNDCPFGYDIGSKIHQESDDTYWELISLPEPCEPLTEEHWKQLRYKATPDQYMHTKQAGVSYFIENIVATTC